MKKLISAVKRLDWATIVIISALLQTLVLECLNRHSLIGGFAFAAQPAVFLINVLLVLDTLFVAFLFKRRAFVFCLIHILWLTCGIINCVTTLCRTLPFTFNVKQARAVICIEMFDRAYDEMICALGLPVVFVDGPHKRDGIDLPADQLYMDNTTAITRFVNDMLVRGKRRIGFIGDYEHCQSFFERYTAFRCAMLMAGVPVDERFCIKVLNPEQLENSLVSMKEFPEVFICANDFVADDAIYVLRKLGKSVPEDVLFCGFDDSPQSRIMTPSLTTVHIHTQIMAVAAMQLLVSRIEQPSLDYRTVHTETELIYRDSTRL